MEQGNQRSSPPNMRITELLKQAHYAQDRDFVCEDAQDTVSKLQKQLHQMWKTLRADLGKCRRYVLMIDRRNPKNLDEKDMAHEPPRYVLMIDRRNPKNLDEKDMAHEPPRY
eukprot:682132_1